MANPILPLWECIPDGEPRQFGDRVYLYGSHDRFGCDKFCDYKLKAWSAPIDDLDHWTCHGHIFQTRPDTDHESSVTHTDHELYAPDVIEKDGKYYLYAYILGARGAVGVSDRPDIRWRVGYAVIWHAKRYEFNGKMSLERRRNSIYNQNWA